MARMVAVAFGVACIACDAGSSRSAGKSAVPPVAVAVTPADAAEDESASLARRAEAALDSDTPLDFERPFADKPRDRAATRALLVDACKAGDKPSCWRAVFLAGLLDTRQLVEIVAANCKAGHMPSCHALALHDSLLYAFPALPGAQGRSAACQYKEPGCDQVALRRECDDGFAQSCERLAMNEAPEWQQLRKRADQLAAADCALDIISQCDPQRSWSESVQADALRRRCRYNRLACETIAHGLDRAGDHAGARDLHEIACQYDDALACVTLATGYQDHTYVEPVPGRSKALLDYACARISMILHTRARAIQEYPACKQASR